MPLNGSGHGQQLSNLKILVAEDNPVNQQVAMKMLTKLGHNVTLAKNGIQAVTAVTTGGFDLVLMDGSMPEMDGFKATKAIKKLGSDIPIIAFTAHAMAGDREEFINAGMDDYISKPIKKDDLKHVIERTMNKR